jgi:hypothetical protein
MALFWNVSRAQLVALRADIAKAQVANLPSFMSVISPCPQPRCGTTNRERRIIPVHAPHFGERGIVGHGLVRHDAKRRGR